MAANAAGLEEAAYIASEYIYSKQSNPRFTQSSAA
jgi:hypothetical protein